MKGKAGWIIAGVAAYLIWLLMLAPVTLALALEESPHHRPTSIQTTAQHDGDNFILKGSKTFVLDGHSADQLLVVARSAGAVDDAEGISLYMVARDTPGVSVQRTIMADSRNAANIRFDNVRVEDSARLGEAGAGWDVLEPVLDRARVAIAAEMMGLALEAFERTVAYLKEREQFGKAIGTFQAVQWMLADMATQIEAARQLVYASARVIDSGAKNINKIAAMGKVFATDTAMKVTTDAVQLFGGYGYCRNYPIEKYMRDAKITQIYEGTSEIQKIVISRAILK